VFDRPDVAEEAARRWSMEPDMARMIAKGGNFFEEVPAGGDLYLLKQILHDWDDERSLVILRNIRASIRPGGRLAIIEMVLPDDASAHPGWKYDILMMTMM
jgi:hypothetical protein